MTTTTDAFYNLLMRGEDPKSILDQYLDTRPAWAHRGACQSDDVNTAWFFATAPATRARARAVCASCPVAPACLRYALDDVTILGIWGGTDEHERRRIRRQAA